MVDDFREDVIEDAVIMHRAVDAINAEIREVFARHSIVPDVGEEAFWEAVELVFIKDPEDGQRLERLAEEWDQTMEADS